MASQDILRQRVLNNLYSAERPERSPVQRLNGSINSSIESVVVDDGTQVSAFDIVEFVSGEQAYVLSIATNTLSVIRGWNGTTAATQADNSFIRINPKWSLAQVDDALSATLWDLSAQGLYLLADATPITLVAGTDVYQITETDVYPQKGVLSVYYQEALNGDLVGVRFHNLYEPGSGVLAGASEFAVRLLTWGNNADGDQLRAIYAKQINNVTDLDNESGLQEALVMGATAKILAMAEGPRIHDPGRFSDRTVQPGQPLRDASFFAGQYQRTVWRYRGYLQAREGNLPGARQRRLSRDR